jgi:hypothetical protein
MQPLKVEKFSIPRLSLFSTENHHVDDQLEADQGHQELRDLAVLGLKPVYLHSRLIIPVLLRSSTLSAHKQCHLPMHLVLLQAKQRYVTTLASLHARNSA